MEEEQTSSASQQTSKFKNFLFLFLGIFFVFVVIGVSIAGTMMLSSRPKDDQPRAEKKTEIQQEEVAGVETKEEGITLTPTPILRTITIKSQATLDGWRASNGGGNTAWYLQIGRNTTLTTRSYVSFDLGAIPEGVTIQKATLRLYQVEVIGSPYSSNNLVVDHVNYGDSLTKEDYDLTPLSSNIGTLTSNAVIEWKDIEVTNNLRVDVSSGRTRNQYRLRFAGEAVGPEAWARFESGDNYKGTGNLPQLVVEYH